MAALASGYARDGCGYRLIDLDCKRERTCDMRHPTEELIHRVALECFGAQQHLMRIRRKVQLPTFFQSLLREFCVTLTAHRCVERVIREVSLDQYFTGDFTTARTARDLCQKREELLGRAKVAAIERAVRVDYTDQRKRWKVVTLCEHLRPDEDVYCIVVDALAHTLKCSTAASAVSIHPQHARLGKQFAQRLLETLCAVPRG